MRVYLIDGTYELFRHYFGRPPHQARDGREVGAVYGVLLSLLRMLADGVGHLGVATDHVIESFRNDLWDGYKDSSGVDPVLLAQFPLLEEAIGALGVTLWPMVQLEADDALASAAKVAGEDPRVEQVLICTPDKDLAQCVVGERIVQLDRRSGKATDAAGVIDKFGVSPASIPDWLALVGDSADGYPGIPGWGKASAAAVLSYYEHLEAIPERAADWAAPVCARVRGAERLATHLADARQAAFLFRDLATLRVEPPVLERVDDLAWGGPGPELAALAEYLRAPDLLALSRRG